MRVCPSHRGGRRLGHHRLLTGCGCPIEPSTSKNHRRASEPSRNHRIIELWKPLNFSQSSSKMAAEFDQTRKSELSRQLAVFGLETCVPARIYSKQTCHVTSFHRALAAWPSSCSWTCSSWDLRVLVSRLVSRCPFSLRRGDVASSCCPCSKKRVSRGPTFCHVV